MSSGPRLRPVGCVLYSAVTFEAAIDSEAIAVAAGLSEWSWCYFCTESSVKFFANLGG